MSTSDTLRRAEARLREVAEGATTKSWEPSHWEPSATRPIDCYDVWTDEGDTVAIGMYHADATYIALMDPLVGLALADWLREEAGDLEAFLSLNPEQVDALPFPTTKAALTLALRVLGEEE